MTTPATRGPAPVAPAPGAPSPAARAASGGIAPAPHPAAPSGAGDAWWTRPPLILAVAALLRVIALVLVEGESHDGTGRVLDAAAWFFEGRPTFGRTMWPDGNYVLPGLTMLLWNEPFWAVRIVYALVALTNVWLVVRVAALAFDRRAGAVAGWLVALMPYHVYVSANAAMSEVPYVSFMLVALWAVLRHREAPALRWAAIAGIAVALATSFRVDGVIWGLPLAASFVLWRPGERRALRLDGRMVGHLAVFGVCGLLYLAALFARWAVLYDSPWYILDEAKANAYQFFVNGQHQRWPAWLYQGYVVGFWPASTFVLLTPAVAALGWVGLARSAAARHRTALPLVLGLVVAMAWLAYATFTHSILAQFRYSLVLAVVLAAFVAPGARALRAWRPRLRTGALVGAAAAVALVFQAAITDASLNDRGVVSRQLGALSPVRRSQFATRGLLEWARANATPAAPLVVTPHVVWTSPYFALRRVPLERDGRVVVQPFYLPDDQLVHTRASLEGELAEKLTRAGAVATNAGPRTIGLRDAIEPELVRPERAADGAVWRGVTLVPERQWGDVQLWRVRR